MNNFLSPTYWGSLVALLTTLLTLVVATVRGAPPSYVSAIAPQEAVSLPIFYCAAAAVALFTIRYYLAITLNVYGGSDDSFHKAHSSIKKFMFVLLCALYFLSTSSVSALSTLGIRAALACCLVMALISLICIIVCWVLSRMDPEKYGATPLSFGGHDAVLFVVTALFVIGISEGPDAKTVVVFSSLVILMGTVILHEMGKHKDEFVRLSSDVRAFFGS